MDESLNKFSNNYKKSLKEAADLALQLNHLKVNPQHILYGLIRQKGSVGAELFTPFELKTDELKNNIAKINQLNPQTETKTIPKFSEESKQLIQKSVQIAYINEHKYIGTEHLLAALLQINNSEIRKILQNMNISEPELTKQIVSVLKSASKLPDLTETFKVTKQKSEKNINQDFFSPQVNALDLFGNNLTSKKIQKKIDPVIGREEEISRIIQILSRRTKNNPIILGDPGTGKTAIAEGLAKKIANSDVPEALQNKKIYAIDLTATVAGTMYRGEFEGRLKQIINEVRNQPDIILFIDEIHNIVGTGSASGSMDTANILKPALARGEIRCIGATTFEDYRKTIENDPALDRRFQAIKINEPTGEQTKEILLGIKKYYENFHRVKINDSAIETAVKLSQRYLQDKFLPDKAIDLIDEACAAIKINCKQSTEEKQIKNLKTQLAEAKKGKDDAILKENFAQAIKFKKEVQEIDDRLIEMENQQRDRGPKMIGEITEKEITEVIARMTGIEAIDLVSSEKKQILKLDKKLKEKIIGQDQAIEAAANIIKLAKAGLTPEDRPLASFMFIGPSGVGKTYTAKIISQLLFNNEDALIRIDMSEYSEKFNISKLIGAPAGYVGYKESGQLTEKVKHKPYSIVLFDEIEKANPEIFDLLLQVLDDGCLTDAAGTKINFRNTIIIMTSNIGSEHISGKNIGFDEMGENKDFPMLEEKIISQVKDNFKIEFLNRLDKIIYFNPLFLSVLQKIVKLELEELNQRLLAKNIKIEFDPKIAKFIAKESSQNDQGARAIKKTIQNLIETPLSQKILEENINPGDMVQIALKNGIINIVNQE